METGYHPCSYCAEPIRDAATICRYCNRAVSPVVPVPSVENRPSSNHQPTVPIVAKNPLKAAGSIIVLVILVVLLIAGIFISVKNSHPGESGLHNRALAGFLPVPVNVKLLSGELEVKARQLRWITFVVPPDASNARVTGTFHAFGGAGNDIQVIVTDPFDFENWKNGHQTQVLYDSDKTTNGTITLSDLKSGKYVLAFDNRFSLFSRKEISGDVTLTYTH